jgi:membrane protease YdiL (CAAX protease family)
MAMLRVLSITAAVPRLPLITWYVTTGGAVLIGVMTAIRFVDDPRGRLRLAIRRPWLDVGIGALGIPAGVVGYVLLRPGQLLPGASPVQILGGIVALVVFAAFTEEVLFRGLLQTVAVDAFGSSRLGVGYAAMLSAVLYLGSGSLPYTIAVGVYALLLGATILRDGSIWGATASHGLALLGMGFVWPVLLGPSPG